MTNQEEIEGRAPPDARMRATIERLLETATHLHDAAVDPARWPEVLRAARVRLALDQATSELAPEQAAWLESMIASATRLAAEVARIELARTMAGSAIATLPIGLVVIDAGGRLIRANLEGERLLRFPNGPASVTSGDGGGTLAEAALSELLALARTAIAQGGTQPCVARLPCGRARPLEALAVAMPGGDHPLAAREPQAVVFLLDPERVADPGERILAASFPFTRAEARLAACLARGDTLQDACRSMGIRTTTGRTHLARLLAKTGTSRQAELVRLLLLTGAAPGPRIAEPGDGDR